MVGDRSQSSVDRIVYAGSDGVATRYDKLKVRRVNQSLRELGAPSSSAKPIFSFATRGFESWLRHCVSFLAALFFEGYL